VLHKTLIVTNTLSNYVILLCILLWHLTLGLQLSTIHACAKNVLYYSSECQLLPIHERKGVTPFTSDIQHQYVPKNCKISGNFILQENF